MSDGLRQRITDILAEHSVCDCGEWAEDIEENTSHQADKLIEQLGMHQRWTWSWPETLTTTGEPGYGYEVDSPTEAAAEGPGCEIVTRYVTPWTGEKP